MTVVSIKAIESGISWQVLAEVSQNMNITIALILLSDMRATPQVLCMYCPYMGALNLHLKLDM